MPHDTPLITTIVAALVLAYVFGAIANRLRMPPIVGYLIAGVCVGPHSPGFVADQTLASQLADIGVVLLMFGVGLNFSLKDLLSVRAVAIPGALIRIIFATAMGVGLATLLGWPLIGGVVFGLALAISSTVVTLKVLQDRHLVDSERGRITVGWLVVEDLATVLALVLIPVLAGTTIFGSPPGADAVIAPPDSFVALAEQLLHVKLSIWEVIGLTLVKLLAFLGFMVVVGRRIIPWILHATAHTGSRELFRLAVLAIALGVAAGAAYLFGVSLALGAFFAGMILSESELSQRAAQETLPLRDAFGVLFFVSVGMLFDPSIVVTQPLPLLATLVIILFGKSIVGFLLMLLFRRPAGTALTVSASLAQIGEFSFILVALGVGLGILPEAGRGLVLAGAIISIVLNPLVFWASERLGPRLAARPVRRAEPELGPVVPDPDEAAALPAPDAEVEEAVHPTSLSNHVVLIGYGRVGGVVGAELLREGAPFVLVEDAEGRVQAAREAGIEVVVGNAATRDTLRLANVMGARCVVIAIPNAFEAGQATEQCRKLNAGVKIIARAHSDEEVDYLHRLGADEVIMGEREIGLGMIDWLKGAERGTTQRAAPPGPKLAGGENLLQQARQAQPAASDDLTAGALAAAALLETAAEPTAVGSRQAAADEAADVPAPAETAHPPATPAETASIAAPPPAPVEAARTPAQAAEQAAARPEDGPEATEGSTPVVPDWMTPGIPAARDVPADPAVAFAADVAAPEIEPAPMDEAAAPAVEAPPVPAEGPAEPDEVRPAPADWTGPADAAPASRDAPEPDPAPEAWDAATLEPPMQAPTPAARHTGPERPDAPAAPPVTDAAKEPWDIDALLAEDEPRPAWHPRTPNPAGARDDAEPPPDDSAAPETRTTSTAGDPPTADRAAEADRGTEPPAGSPPRAAAAEPAASANGWADAPAATPGDRPTAANDPASWRAAGMPEVKAMREPAGSGASDWLAEPTSADTPAAPEAWAEPEPEPAEAAADDRPSGGFRVVPASEIDILPPESAAGTAGEPAEPSPTFRSEYWEEDEPPRAEAGGEPQLFATGTGPSISRLRNVQEPAPPAVDDDTWLAALERDLFGDKAASDPKEDPPPVPQPVETPHPQEDPAPPAQPIETPRPPEEPQPAPQPIETPVPQEIPGPAPQPVPPVTPPTRADAASAATASWAGDGDADR